MDDIVIDCLLLITHLFTAVLVLFRYQVRTRQRNRILLIECVFCREYFNY